MFVRLCERGRKTGAQTMIGDEIIHASVLCAFPNDVECTLVCEPMVLDIPTAADVVEHWLC